MSVFSHFAVQKAVYETLTNDAILESMVNGVFDRPPQGTNYPYITIGESSVKDWSSATSSGTEQLITLHAWSRDGGRKQSANLLECIYNLLHNAALNITGQELVMIHFHASIITLESDGFTYQGKISFRILLETI